MLVHEIKNGRFPDLRDVVGHEKNLLQKSSIKMSWKPDLNFRREFFFAVEKFFFTTLKNIGQVEKNEKWFSSKFTPTFRFQALHIVVEFTP